jgi:hypothetical protein
MRFIGRAVILALMLIGGLAPTAQAQCTLSCKLVTLFDVELAPGTSRFGSSAQDFSLFNPEVGLGAANGQATALQIVDQFLKVVPTQLASVPLGSSSGGFTYSFDSSLGTSVRNTQTFGPTFADRAITIGARQFTFGFNYQHVHVDSLGGQSLSDGTAGLYISHFLTNAAEDTDLVKVNLQLSLSQDTAVFFANYGVTNRLDVSVIVPVVRISMSGTSTQQIIRLATAATPTVHEFPNGGSVNVVNQSGTATGIGDILLRAKYQLVRVPGGGLAVALDVRLPSGNADNLLGTGSTQTKLVLIASGARDRFSPHANLGYAFTSGSTAVDTASGGAFSLSAPDEFDYTGGVEFAALPKLTILGDLIGRNLRNIGQLTNTTPTFNYQTVNGGPLIPITFPAPSLSFQPGSVNLLLGTVGAKFNVWEKLLVSANVLFPITSSGLRIGVAPVVGLEYAF